MYHDSVLVCVFVHLGAASFPSPEGVTKPWRIELVGSEGRISIENVDKLRIEFHQFL